MSNERAIILLFLAWIIPSIIYFVINYLLVSGKNEFNYDSLKPVYIIVDSISSLILLKVCFSIRLNGWREIIIFLTLIQVFTSIYWNFFN
jgi:hypothetical protein